MDHSCSEVVHSVRSEKRSLFHGTVDDEQKVLAVCLARLSLGKRQVVLATTRSGLQEPPDGRMLLKKGSRSW